MSWISYCGESEQLARFYRAADIFVHPGVQETFGLVTLESQACGTPVVGIRGSYMDRIIHSDQAYWARENTPAALAQAILETSAQNLRKIGGQTSKKVLTLYSWTACLNDCLQFTGLWLQNREYWNGGRKNF